MKCIEVERKINLLALAAFVISLAGIAGQVRAYLRGADLYLFPPEQVMLVTSPNPTRTDFVRIAARMAYINRGAKGYHEIVRREWVSFRLGGAAYHQNWQDFVETCDISGKPELQHRSSAMPIRVDPTHPAAHITYFAPRPVKEGGIPSNRNFLSIEQFMIALADEQQIVFEFWAETLSGEWHSAKCRVDAGDVRAEWALRGGFAAPVCQDLATS